MKFRFSLPLWPVVPVLSALLLLLFASLSVGWYHPDEHFQILEFAGLKLSLTSPEHLPWEYPAKMRSAIQPAFVVLLFKLLAPIGITSPFTISLVLRILSAGLSFASMWMIYKCYAKQFETKRLKNWFLLLSFLTWFALYNNVRFCSEIWSGGIFTIGFTYLFLLNRTPRIIDYLLTGFLAGLAFVLRFQAGFLVAGFLCWFVFIRRERLTNMVAMITGILLAVGTGIVIDGWFYGEWTLTAWNYFRMNILEDKISGFGINPWYYFLEEIFLLAIPPFSLVFLAAPVILFIFRRKDILTWTLLPFILVHFLVTHKEARFLFPVIGFLPVIVITSVQILRDKWNPRLTDNIIVKGFARIFWIVNGLLTIIMLFIPADRLVGMYHYVYENYQEPVTLCFVKKDPYQRALYIRFYKRENLVVVNADSCLSGNREMGNRYLVAFDNRDREQARFLQKIKDKRVIWSSHPEWVRKFNFNGWLDRSAFWYLYEVGK